MFIQKIALCISVLFFAGTLAQAKGSGGGRKIMAVVGAAQTTMDTTDSQCIPICNAVAATGLQAGVNIDFPLGSMVALRTGAMYVQRIAKYSQTGLTGDASYNYNSIDIPLNFVIMFGDFSIVAGASAGIKSSTSCSATGSRTCTGFSSLVEDKSTIIPIQIGLGYVLAQKISLQVMYEPYTDLATIKGATYVYKTSSLGARIGFIF
jgi:hypothetical protein